MKVNNFWNYYALYPYKGETAGKKAGYWIASIAIGVLTCGTYQGVVALNRVFSKKNVPALILETNSAIGGTYNYTPDTCCDYAFSNPVTGVIAVFDAAGHDSKDVHDEQVPLFEEFCNNFSESLTGTKFTSLNEAGVFLEKKFKDLAEKFVEIQDEHMLTGTKYAGPAAVCGFVVQIKQKNYFVYAQVADCCICYKTKDTIEFIATAKDTGLGDGGGTNLNKYGHLPTISAFEIDTPCDIYVFSDGIAEFLTEEEFVDVINSNPAEDLLPAFREAIMEEKVDDPGRIRIAQRPQVKKPLTCKAHSLENRGQYDDISLAHMNVSL